MNQHNSPCNRWVIGKAVLPQHIVLEIKRDALRVPHTGVSLGAQDHSIAEESAAAPAPVAGHVNADYSPVRPSLSAFDLEVDPCRPIEKSAIHDGRCWRVVEGRIPAVKTCDHGCCYDTNGGNCCQSEPGNGKPVGQGHSIGLLLIQGVRGGCLWRRPAHLDSNNRHRHRPVPASGGGGGEIGMELLAGATFGLLSVGLHTRGESERIDQEQLGEVSHLRGLLLREYLVFLVGGLVSVQAYDVCPFPHRGRHEMPLSEHVYTSQQVVREGHFGAGDSCGCSLKNLPKHHSGARPVSAAQAVLSFVKVPRDALWNVIRGLKLFNLRLDVDQIESAHAERSPGPGAHPPDQRLCRHRCAGSRSGPGVRGARPAGYH